MRRNKNVIITILSFLLIVLIELIAYYYHFIREEDKINISVIVYDDDKNWADIKEGAELAAERHDNAEINFIIMQDGTSSSEQRDTIIKEYEAGADYIVAAAIDSKDLGESLRGAYAGKLSFIVNGVDDTAYKQVTAQDYEMGYDLGKLIAKEEGPEALVSIVYIDDKKNNLNARYEGLVKALAEADCKYTVWQEKDINGNLNAFTYGQIVNKKTNTIVSLSENSLDNIIAAVNATQDTVPIYTIAHSDKAVYYLDSKQLKYIVYPDEFGEGYAAIEELLEASAVNTNKKIDYKLINGQDMYTGEYEKVLFPFVK